MNTMYDECDQPEAYEQGDDRTQEDSLFELVEELQNDNARLRTMLQELVIFGAAATDQENDPSDQKAANAILAGLVAQARNLLKEPMVNEANWTDRGGGK